MNERAAHLIVSYRARKRGEIDVPEGDSDPGTGIPTWWGGSYLPAADPKAE